MRLCHTFRVGSQISLELANLAYIWHSIGESGKSHLASEIHSFFHQRPSDALLGLHDSKFGIDIASRIWQFKQIIH